METHLVCRFETHLVCRLEAHYVCRLETHLICRLETHLVCRLEAHLVLGNAKPIVFVFKSELYSKQYSYIAVKMACSMSRFARWIKKNVNRCIENA